MLKGEVQSLFAESTSTVFFIDEKLIEERVTATEFQAESEGQHHVADDLFSNFKQPDVAKEGPFQECQCRAASPLSTEWMGAMRVEILHHAKKNLDVVGVRCAKQKSVAQAEITLAHQIVAGDVIVAQFAEHRERNIFRPEELLSNLLYLVAVHSFNIFQHLVERKKVFEI